MKNGEFYCFCFFVCFLYIEHDIPYRKLEICECFGHTGKAVVGDIFKATATIWK